MSAAALESASPSEGEEEAQCLPTGAAPSAGQLVVATAAAKTTPTQVLGVATSPPPIVCSLGEQAPCAKCGAFRTDTSPLDPPGGPRQWGPGGSPRCQMCEDVVGILGPEDSGPCSMSQWLSWVQAFVSLRLEGFVASAIAKVALDDRRRILEMVKSLAPPGAASSFSIASDSGVSTGPGAVAAASGATSMSEDAFVTPTKAARCTSSPSASQLASPDGSAVSVSPSVQPVPQARSSGEVSAAARSSGAETCTAIVLAATRGAPSPPSVCPSLPVITIVPLSLGGAFPTIAGNPTLAQSLTRIKSTVNSYVDSLGNEDWFDTYKTATMKALAGRLHKHKQTVADLLCIDIVTAYTDVVARLAALMSLYKALCSWCTTGLPQHLLTANADMNVLGAYLHAVDIKFSGTMRIVHTLAHYQYVAINTRQLSQAVCVFDMDMLEEAFKDKAASATAIVGDGNSPSMSIEHDVGVKAESVSGAGDSSTLDRKGGRAGKPPPSLVLPGTPAKLVVATIDTSLQLELHELPKKLDDMKPLLPPFVSDLRGLSIWLRDHMERLGEEAANIHQFVDALASILEATYNEAVKPSDVRAGRQLIYMLASGANPLKSAQGATHYSGMREAMEAARLLSSVGVSDYAADKGFDATNAMLEELLEVAFESTEDFIHSGNEGDAQDIDSMLCLLDKVNSAATDWQVSLSQWSHARLEERASDLATSLSHAFLIVDSSVWVGVAQFLKVVPGFASLGGIESEPTSCIDDVGGPPRGDDSRTLDVPTACVRAASGESPAAVASETAGNVGVEDPSTPIDFETMAKDALASLPLLEELFEKVLRRCTELSVIVETLSAKIPSAPDELDELGVDPSFTMKTAKHVAELIGALTSYIADMSKLAPFAKNAPSNSEGNIAGDCVIDLKLLASFCNTHLSIGTNLSLHIDWTQPFDHFDNAQLLTHAAQALKTYHGGVMYEKLVSPTMRVAVSSLEALQVRVQACSPEAIASNSVLAELLPLLVVEPSIDALATTGIDLRKDIADMLEDFPHNSALKKLSHFAEVVGATSLDLKTMKPVGVAKDMGGIPLKEALLHLSLTCRVRNVATVAAMVHNRLLAATGARSLMEAEALIAVPILLACLLDAMEALQGELQSADVSSFEAGPWHMTAPPPTLRTWLASMRVFTRKCTDKLLRDWSERLSTTSALTRSACPSWQVAVTTTDLKLELAFGIIQGRLSAVADSHNALHSMVSEMGAMSTLMKLHPRLQDNPLTQDSVAVAVHTLRDASTTATVIEILELLRVWEAEVGGATIAKEYLAKHPKHARNHEVPAPLWTRLEVLATEGSRSLKTPVDDNPSASRSAPSSLAEPASALGGRSEAAQSVAVVVVPSGVGAKRDARAEKPLSGGRSKLRRLCQ